MHFYDKYGEPRHYVPMASDPSRLRPSRISDAKKHSWYPSVTTIQGKVFGTPEGLKNWIIEQHLIEAYSLKLPKPLTHTEYIEIIKERAETRMDIARQMGSDFHRAMELALKGHDVPAEYSFIVAKVRKELDKWLR